MITAFVLLAVSLALVLAEVLFPSFGLFSLLAGVCLFAADWIAFEQSNTWGWAMLGSQLVLVPLVVWLGFRWLPHTGIGQRMLLRGSSTPGGSVTPDHARLVGLQGVAETDLRPGGTARIEGLRHSVVALGGYIEPGTPIAVTGVEGTEIRVRALEKAPTSKEQV